MKNIGDWGWWESLHSAHPTPYSNFPFWLPGRWLLGQLRRRDRSAGLELLENVLGQFVVGSQLGSLGEMHLGFGFRSGHQIVVTQQEMPGRRGRHIGYRLFQLAKLLGVPIGIVVIGIKMGPIARRAKASAAWASVAAPRYSPEANKASDVNSWTFGILRRFHARMFGQTKRVAIIAPRECSPSFVVILETLVFRCLAVCGGNLWCRPNWGSPAGWLVGCIVRDKLAIVGIGIHIARYRVLARIDRAVWAEVVAPISTPAERIPAPIPEPERIPIPNHPAPSRPPIRPTVVMVPAAIPPVATVGMVR